VGAGRGSAQVTVSVGLTGCVANDTVATILNRAEEALWDSVREGGNRVVMSVNDKLAACTDELLNLIARTDLPLPAATDLPAPEVASG
jgi:hypothetical protein